MSGIGYRRASLHLIQGAVAVNAYAVVTNTMSGGLWLPIMNALCLLVTLAVWSHTYRWALFIRKGVLNVTATGGHWCAACALPSVVEMDANLITKHGVSYLESHRRCVRCDATLTYAKHHGPNTEGDESHA